MCHKLYIYTVYVQLCIVIQSVYTVSMLEHITYIVYATYMELYRTHRTYCVYTQCIVSYTFSIYHVYIYIEM